MGSFYTNIALKGPPQAAVAAEVRAARRAAYVAPTRGDITLLYDLECESQDTRTLYALAANLSSRLACTALAALVHDDDFLIYALFQHGVQVDEYHSDPAYFEPRAPEPPRGGDPAVLCAAFGATAEVARVETILRAWSGPEGNVAASPYLFAQARHRDLARALDLPEELCVTGYLYIEQGEVDTTQMIQITP